MNNDWASENLQVIRTLMERSALYRRALAPVMFLLGSFGLLAAAVGSSLHITSARSFLSYWLTVSILPVVGSMLLIRQQALRDSEPFWSPPTRRVVQAMLPALSVGLLIGLALLFMVRNLSADEGQAGLANFFVMAWVPSAWMIFYGIAIHAAGFFMQRGIKLLGWLFILTGGSLFAFHHQIPAEKLPDYGHAIMGLGFGSLQLAYGGYLWFTEKRKHAA